jgi:hypothetical protein
MQRAREQYARVPESDLDAFRDDLSAQIRRSVRTQWNRHDYHANRERHRTRTNARRRQRYATDPAYRATVKAESRHRYRRLGKQYFTTRYRQANSVWSHNRYRFDPGFRRDKLQYARARHERNKEAIHREKRAYYEKNRQRILERVRLNYQRQKLKSRVLLLQDLINKEIPNGT